MYTSAGAPFRAIMLGSTDATTGTVTGVTTGTSKPFDMQGWSVPTIYLLASAALSEGTLIIEEADFDPTLRSFGSLAWSNIATRTLATDFTSAGGWEAIHLAQSAYSYLRVRIGATVVGGTLIVTMKAA